MSKIWDPNASRSGLDKFEQHRYQESIRRRYKPNESQQRYDKCCIRCHTYFNMPEEDYFHTECPSCRTIPGLINNPPPVRIIPDPREDNDHGRTASRKYAEESKSIIQLLLADRTAEALSAMLDMAEKYPDCGWEQAHDDLIATLNIDQATEMASETDEPATLPF